MEELIKNNHPWTKETWQLSQDVIDSCNAFYKEAYYKHKIKDTRCIFIFDFAAKIIKEYEEING